MRTTNTSICCRISERQGQAYTGGKIVRRYIRTGFFERYRLPLISLPPKGIRGRSIASWLKRRQSNENDRHVAQRGQPVLIHSVEDDT